MAHIISVISGKGGVGKTTTTARIGESLAILGKRTLMVDLDTELCNLDIVFGLTELATKQSFEEVASGKCDIKKALHEINDNLYLLLSAKISKQGQKVSFEDFRGLLNNLSRQFDYIFLDCPAGIGEEFKHASSLCNEFIIVTTPDLTAIRDAQRIKMKITECKKMHLIVNMIRPKLVKQGLMVDPMDVSKILDLKLAGCIPDDPGVIVANNTASTEAKEGRAISAYIKAAKRILGETIEIDRFWENTEPLNKHRSNHKKKKKNRHKQSKEQEKVTPAIDYNMTEEKLVIKEIQTEENKVIQEPVQELTREPAQEQAQEGTIVNEPTVKKKRGFFARMFGRAGMLLIIASAAILLSSCSQVAFTLSNSAQVKEPTSVNIEESFQIDDDIEDNVAEGIMDTKNEEQTDKEITDNIPTKDGTTKEKEPLISTEDAMNFEQIMHNIHANTGESK